MRIELLRVIAVLIVMSLDADVCTGSDRFETEVSYLRKQNLQAVGREALIGAYSEFIERNANDPRIAEAMLDVAHLLENEIRQKNITADPRRALVWYRKAGQAAKVGSQAWQNAQLAIVNRTSDSNEARRILQDVAAAAGDDSRLLCRVEHDLISTCLRSGDWNEAERHASNVMDWYRDAARIPRDSLEKADIDVMRLSAGNIILHAWSGAPWPKSERRRKVQEFANHYAIIGGSLKTDADLALRHIDESPDTVVVQSRPSDAPARAGRIIFLIVNVVVLLIIAAFWYFRAHRAGHV